MNTTRRDVLALSAAGLAAVALPHRLIAASLQGGGRELPGSALRVVDAELRSRGLLNPSIVNAANLAETRAKMTRWTPPYLAGPAVVARMIPGPKGAPEVRVLVINAAVAPSVSLRHRPALLWIHGGGYVAGTAAGEAAIAQQIALEQDCVIVSVDYRLAPETRFPGSLEDNYAALKWLYAHAAELGVDPARIALMGTSAGGGHVAMLSAAARDRGEVPVLFQLMLSPMLDDCTGSTRQPPPGVGELVWTAESNRFGWSSFLGVPAGSRRVPDGAVPARRVDLRGLPPTYIGVGSIDLFVGENIDYAARLIEAGVQVELNVVPGAYHVFFAIRPDADVSKRFRASYSSALSRAFRLAAS